jgi:hypothetical protein
MNKTKAVVRLLAAALLLSVAGNVEAGGGGFGGPNGEPMVQCWDVQHGDDPGFVLEVNDQFTDPSVGRVGKLKMVCAPADFRVLNDAQLKAFENADHFSCYEAPQAKAVPSTFVMQDAFSEQRLQVRGHSRLICVLGRKTCESGCPVVSPPAP